MFNVRASEQASIVASVGVLFWIVDPSYLILISHIIDNTIVLVLYTSRSKQEPARHPIESIQPESAYSRHPSINNK